MPKFIAISGPSSTGKTQLVSILRDELKSENVIFCNDLYNTVWQELIDTGIFKDYTEIMKDSDYVCLYLFRLLDHYEKLLEDLEDQDSLIVFDCCWLDLLIYSQLNLWYTHTVKEMQETIIKRISRLIHTVDRIYITSEDRMKVSNNKYRDPLKIYSAKANRPLELRYYEMASILYNSVAVPKDIKEASGLILEDLRNLGYL